jgi:short subunit dehydrogenase-like uncharacterized protein
MTAERPYDPTLRKERERERPPERQYDVVVYGATGFTGGLVAEYLAKHVGNRVRWAIAGRNPERLEEVKEYLVALDPACADVGVIEADSRDWASLVIMANKARVVLTTVGPYVKAGDKLVRACVASGTDYVDITGEPEFVNRVLAEYDQPAREKGVRIVNCCGFDSIPPDLGVLYTVLRLPEDEPIAVEGYVQAKVIPSGGTWQSLVLAASRIREGGEGKERVVSAPEGRRVRAVKPSFRYHRELGGWVFPMPTIDPLVVCRSARAIERYGPDFRYAHAGKSSSLARVVLTGLGAGLVVALAQFEPTRQRLLDYRKSGEGPTAEQRAANWFKITFLGKSDSKEVVTRVSGGDAGYSETAKMVAESALCLVEDRDRLPERTGVLTPAMAMGEVLIERLQRAGIRFEVLDERDRSL